MLLIIYQYVLTLCLFTLPLIWIIWTIALIKKQQKISIIPETENLIPLSNVTSSIEFIDGPSLGVGRVFKGMLWSPFTTLEKYRKESTPKSFFGLILLCLAPALGASLMSGLKGMVFMFFFSMVFLLLIATYIHVLGKIFGGLALYGETLRGVALSLVPFYFGILIIGIVNSMSTVLALVVLWPTLGLSLISMWWMFKHYQEIKGGRLFFVTLLSLIGISIFCFFVALMWASGART